MVARRILVDVSVCVPSSKTELEDTVNGPASLGSAGDEEMIGRRGRRRRRRRRGAGRMFSKSIYQIAGFLSRDAMHRDGSPIESIGVKYVDCGRIAALCYFTSGYLHVI